MSSDTGSKFSCNHDFLMNQATSNYLERAFPSIICSAPKSSFECVNYRIYILYEWDVSGAIVSAPQNLAIPLTKYLVGGLIKRHFFFPACILIDYRGLYTLYMVPISLNILHPCMTVTKKAPLHYINILSGSESPK